MVVQLGFEAIAPNFWKIAWGVYRQSLSHKNWCKLNRSEQVRLGSTCPTGEGVFAYSEVVGEVSNDA